MNIFWARYDWTANRRRVASAYVAIAAGTKAAAMKRAEKLTPDARMALPADAKRTLRITVLGEQEMIDDTEARAFVAEPIGPGVADSVNPREAALAELLNLVREIADDPQRQLLIDEDGREVACLRLDDLRRALASGPFGNDYAIVGEAEGFAKAQRKLIAEALGVPT